jgi:hypothetical protein
MLSAPKGQEGIQDSHPVQASLSINNLAIRSSYLNWKIGIMEWWVKKHTTVESFLILVSHYSNIPSFQRNLIVII